MEQNAAVPPLHAAASAGNIEALNRLLSEGADVNGRDAGGRTALHHAARSGYEQAVRHLLKWGGRVDPETIDGVTPLMTAARGGHAAVVRLLLAKGADPNQFIHPKKPILTPEIREQLLTSGGSLRAETVDELMASVEKTYEPRRSGADNLRRAIMSGDANTLAAILEAGVDPKSPGPGKEIPLLHHAVFSRNLDMVRLLIQHGADVNVTEAQGQTALSDAAMHQRLDIARVLLESGADPNAGKMPPLRFAIHRDDIEMVKLLLSFGAEPKLASAEGGVSPSVIAMHKPEILALFAAHQGTDWQEAVKCGDLNEVRARLDAGAKVDGVNDRGETALQIAAKAGHVGIVQLLLDRGADVNAADKYQRTPLLLAIPNDHIEVVRLLIDRGADITATDQWGHTPISYATSEKRRGIRNILIAAGGRIGIVEAAMMGDNAAVMAFLADGIPADERNEAGMTALMAAAERGDITLATHLHDRGADIEVRDKRDGSPFTYAIRSAVENGSTDLLDLLIRWGADVNGCGENGANALYDAITLRSETVVGYLLQKGADPNRPMLSVGWTPLHAAIRIGRGDLGIISLLLDHGADIEGADTLGSTPLMTAVTLIRKSVMPDAGFEDDQIYAVVRLLIQRGANVNAAGKTRSVLALAADAGDVEVIRLLLDAGADPVGANTLTPLIRASMHGHQDVVALLRERGAPALGAGDGQKGIHDAFMTSFMTAAMRPGFPNNFLDALTKMRQKRAQRQE